MNRRFNIVSFLMLLSCIELYSMHRVLKSRAFDSTIAAGLGAGVMGLAGSSISTILVHESALNFDIVTSGGISACTGAILTAPVFFGWDAFQESGHHEIQIDRFRHKLQNDAFRSLKTLTWQVDDKIAMNNLLRAQWGLHEFDARYKKLINLEGLVLGIAPAVVVPLSLVFGVQAGGAELCTAGLSMSYLFAGIAVAQEKLQLRRVNKAIKECSSFDENIVSPEFIEKNKAMVTRLHAQFEPIRVDYEDHTNWNQSQIKENGEFYYPNINERIDQFDQIMKAELEDFKF